MSIMQILAALGGGAGKTLSLLHFDGANNSTTFTDDTGKSWSVVLGSIVVSTAQSVFGGASGSFPTTTNSRIRHTPSPAISIGTGDFTVELWVRFNSTPGNTRLLFDGRPTSTDGLYPCLYVGSDASFRYYQSTADQIISAAGLAAGGTWRHVVAMRTAGVIRMFVNGDQVGADFTSSASLSCELLTIGTSNRATTIAGLDGFIDEFRLSSVARYTPGYTVPTSELTGSIAPVALLHFEDAVGAASMLDDTGKSWSRSGQATTSGVEKMFGNFSLLLDGTGDFLSTAHSADFDLATSNFTIECWVRPATITKQMCMISHRPSTGLHGFMFQITSAGKLGFQYSNGGTGSNSWVDIAGATTLGLNVWTHVAVTFDGTTVRLFVNGTLDGSTTTFDGSRADTATPALIGRDRDTNPTRDFNGYIDELRLIKGSAIYTSSFTPPTEQFRYTSTLLNFNGTNGSTTFTDETGKTWTANGNAQLSTAAARFGSASLLCDGTGDFISNTAGNADFNISSAGDFTVECWFNPTNQANSDGNALICVGNASGYWQIIARDNTLRVNIRNSTGGAFSDIQGNWTLVNGQWHHIAWVRESGIHKLFCNGQSVPLTTNTAPSTFTTGNNFAYIGANFNGGVTSTEGYIDDVRIVKGRALYRNGFSVPSAPFSLD